MTEKWRKQAVLSRLVNFKSQPLMDRKDIGLIIGVNITGKNLISESSPLPPNLKLPQGS